LRGGHEAFPVADRPLIAEIIGKQRKDVADVALPDRLVERVASWRAAGAALAAQIDGIDAEIGLGIFIAGSNPNQSRSIPGSAGAPARSLRRPPHNSSRFRRDLFRKSCGM
jgi:hypothetical protein